jgi:hypothetical protein
MIPAPDGADAGASAVENLSPLTPCFDTPVSPATQHEGSAPPSLPPDLSPLAAPIRGGWRAFGREDIARLHRLYYDQRIEVKEIARVWRVSTSTLLRWVDEMDWPCRRDLTRQAAAQRLAFGREIRAAATSDADFSERAQDGAAQAELAREDARRGDEFDALEREAQGWAKARAEARAEVLAFAGQGTARGGRFSGAGPIAAALPRDFDDAAPVDAGSLVADVERAVRRELALIESNLNDPSAGARERNARAVANLVRALNGVKELRENLRGGDRMQDSCRDPYRDPYDDGPPPPRDLARLREELAADIERMVAQEDAAKREREEREAARGGGSF